MGRVRELFTEGRDRAGPRQDRVGQGAEGAPEQRHGGTERDKQLGKSLRSKGNVTLSPERQADRRQYCRGEEQGLDFRLPEF